MFILDSYKLLNFAPFNNTSNVAVMTSTTQEGDSARNYRGTIVNGNRYELSTIAKTGTLSNTWSIAKAFTYNATTKQMELS